MLAKTKNKRAPPLQMQQPDATEEDRCLSPMDEDEELLEQKRADPGYDSAEDGWGEDYEAPPYDADDADNEESEDEEDAAYFDENLDRYVDKLVRSSSLAQV